MQEVGSEVEQSMGTSTLIRVQALLAVVCRYTCPVGFEVHLSALENA